MKEQGVVFEQEHVNTIDVEPQELSFEHVSTNPIDFQPGGEEDDEKHHVKSEIVEEQEKQEEGIEAKDIGEVGGGDEELFVPNTRQPGLSRNQRLKMQRKKAKRMQTIARKETVETAKVKTQRDLQTIEDQVTPGTDEYGRTVLTPNYRLENPLFLTKKNMASLNHYCAKLQ